MVYLFGLPRAVEPGGIEMDLDAIVTFTTSLDGDREAQVRFVQQTGVLSSALEHAVPEQMFAVNTEAVCPHFTDSRCPVFNGFTLADQTV